MSRETPNGDERAALLHTCPRCAVLPDAWCRSWVLALDEHGRRQRGEWKPAPRLHLDRLALGMAEPAGRMT